MTSATFTIHCLFQRKALGRGCLPTPLSIAGVTFMNEFAPYAMQAPPLKKSTHQRFTVIDL